MPTPCTCGAGTHHPSCRYRRRGHATTHGRPVTVRKLGLWWLWYCQLPACLDHAGHGHGYDHYLAPAAAADAGRAHHHLWHTDPAAGYEHEDANDDDWTPTAETGMHVVRPQATHGGVPVDGGDEDMAGMAGATGGHDDRLPVCGRVYIAGPMTGLPEHNYPAFHRAAAKLRAAGWHVESPAEPGKVDGWTWADYMRRGLQQMLTCDTIALLPHWHGSRGALIEARLAALVLGMTTILLDVHGEQVAL